MHTPLIFVDLLVILLVSVPVAFLCLRLKLPLLVGLMLTGIAIGPYGLGLVKDIGGIEVLAEIGVMLLLFTIGLEFSISRLAQMKRLVFIGGGLQIVLTTVLAAAAATFFGRPLNQSVFFGFLVALSSTAIVLKSYVDRNEVNAPHARAGIGILLLQDISLVFMLLAVPLLAGGSTASPASIAINLGISLVALMVLVFASWYLLPRFLNVVVHLRSPEAMLLTVVLFFLGMSWMTSQFGLSLALGAFIAGIVLADSDYSHQITADILPFRDVFNSLFFVSIGMLMSVPQLFARIVPVAILVIALIGGKALLIWFIMRILGNPQRIAVMTALGLAQIGEFSFVLARAGQDTALLPEADYQSFLAASILSMIATPFLIQAAPKIGYFFQKLLRDGRAADIANTEEEIHLTSSGGLQHHVIIIGYGLNGRNLARVLRAVSVPYTILDVDPDAVRRAKEKGEKINFGDATRREVLIHAGIDQALTMVVAVSDPQAARRVVDQANRLNPNLNIIVRTRYVSEITELLDLGANVVIPEEFETSIEIFSRVLKTYGIARNVVEEQIAKIRRQGYEMLRLPALPGSTSAIANLNVYGARTETVGVSETSPAVGKSLGELDLRGQSGATVIAVIRDGETKISPGANFELNKGDTVVLLGPAEKIGRAVELIEPQSAAEGFNP